MKPASNHPGPQIAKLREARGFTVRRVAELARTNKSVITRIESGAREPVWDTACRIADALGVGLDELRALANHL